MEVKIEWLPTAEKNLRDIFDYYKIRASAKIASDIISGIIEVADILIAHPFIGQREELLLKRKIEYRYLVYGNYKIIYSVSRSFRFIHMVFDARQNPKKLRQVK